MSVADSREFVLPSWRAQDAGLTGTTNDGPVGLDVESFGTRGVDDARTEITTSRLTLRRCEGSDVEAVLAYRQRSDVGKYLRDGTWSHAKAVREIAAYSVAPFSAPGDELVLLAETRDGAAVVGEVGLLWSGERTAEMGYVFNPRYGGQGLATEAVSAIINFARCRRGFLRVIARTDAANVASIALCRRLGMQLLSTALSTDGRRVPECVFSTGVRTDAAP